MIGCDEVRRRLWPVDAMRVDDAEIEAAIEHASDCPECSSFLEQDRRLAEFIRESVPRERAPRELRERLYTALARERAGLAGRREKRTVKSRHVALGVLAFSVVALGSTGYWLTTDRQPAPAADAFAEDYLRRVIEQEVLLTGDRQEVAVFFARELGVAMPPPDVPNFQVRRATICLMNGRRGGVVEYEGHGNVLSYYLIPLAETAGSALPQFTGSGPNSPSLSSERGLGVATWWDGRHQHALVGSLPTQDLKRLAPLFVCPTSRL